MLWVLVLLFCLVCFLFGAHTVFIFLQNKDAGTVGTRLVKCTIGMYMDTHTKQSGLGRMDTNVEMATYN